VKIFFGTDVNRGQERVLNAKGVKHRLFSFARLPKKLDAAAQRRAVPVKR